MTWTCVLRPREMATYRRCRREWDFGARLRQDYVPTVPSKVFDFDLAMHAGLATYYFPAMDDWDRSIVRPLAIKAFQRAMGEHLARYESVASLSEEDGQVFDRAFDQGEAILNSYFAWSAPLDTFASIFSDQEYWAPIPDPANPGSDLVDHAGREMRYLGRVDQLFSDHNDEYWIAQHRIVAEWEDDDQFLLDLDGVADLWAIEATYPQLRIAGIVYNELRMEVEADPVDALETFNPRADGRTMRRPRHIHTRRSPMSPALEAVSTDEMVRRETGEWFRRTYIRRGRASVDAAGLAIATQAAELANPALRIYPSPSHENCRTCVFRAPCIAVNEGADPKPILAASYRRRTQEEGEEERLRWSIGRAQTRASMSGKDSRPETVNFKWG
jgi:hypothetical protein